MNKSKMSKATSWKMLFVFRGSKNPRMETGLAIASFIALLAIWSLITYLELLPKQYLASPLAVIKALYQLFVKFNFINDIWISIYRVWVAFLAAALMAIPLGIFPGAGTCPPYDFMAGNRRVVENYLALDGHFLPTGFAYCRRCPTRASGIFRSGSYRWG